MTDVFFLSNLSQDDGSPAPPPPPTEELSQQPTPPQRVPPPQRNVSLTVPNQARPQPSLPGEYRPAAAAPSFVKQHPNGWAAPETVAHSAVGAGMGGMGGGPAPPHHQRNHGYLGGRDPSHGRAEAGAPNGSGIQIPYIPAMPSTPMVSRQEALSKPWRSGFIFFARGIARDTVVGVSSAITTSFIVPGGMLI